MENWDDVRFLIATVEEGSMSAAARRLGVGQATVSRRIRQMEERLEVRLFEALPTGLRLTAAAEAILPEAREMEVAAQGLHRRLRGLERGLCGTVSMTATEGIASCWLPEKIALLRERAPDILVRLCVRNDTANLAQRSVDIALRFGEPQSPSLVGSRAVEVHFGLYAARRYLERFGTPESPADLVRHRLIRAHGQIARFRQMQDLHALMAEAEASAEIDSVWAQLALADQGLGVICTSPYIARHRPALVRLMPRAFDVRVPLWLLTHADVRDNPRIRLVMDFLKAEFRRDRERVFVGPEAPMVAVA